jgi:VCBS repeat-containing protein
VGAAITGAFGTLTLNADGSYSYVHAGAAGGGTDVFTYTIRDADGSQSTTTLNIAVADSSPGGISIPPEGVASAGTLVDEAGLGARGSEPAGSNPAAPTTTVGTIAFTSVDGVSKVELGGLVLTTSGTPQTVTDATGLLTASFTYNAATGEGTINYSYTLLDNTLGVPNTSFAVAVTDKDGDRTVAGSSLVIDIKDDGPVAHADTDIIAAGQTAAETGNVLSGFGTADGTANADIPGADGGLTVVSVAAGGGTAVAVGLTAGATIAGAFGTLTLNSDGSYSYVHTTGSGTDVFTYTIQDADGSQSTATLNIAVSDSSPGDIVIPPPGGADTQVFEAGLGARGSEPAGSHTGEAGFPTTTQTGTITFTSPGLRTASPRHARLYAGHPRLASQTQERRGWPGQARP